MSDLNHLRQEMANLHLRLPPVINVSWNTRRPNRIAASTNGIDHCWSFFLNLENESKWINLNLFSVHKNLITCMMHHPSTDRSGVPFLNPKSGVMIKEIPLDKIRRPLMRTRTNDPVKVKELMESIREIGLQQPVTFDFFEVCKRSMLIRWLLELFTDRCAPSWRNLLRFLRMPSLRGAPATRSPDHTL